MYKEFHYKLVIMLGEWHMKYANENILEFVFIEHNELTGP